MFQTHTNAFDVTTHPDPAAFLGRHESQLEQSPRQNIDELGQRLRLRPIAGALHGECAETEL